MVKKLTVLNVAYPFAPVRLETAGGAEQVVSVLDHALYERGAVSLVVACSGSRIKGHLIRTPRVRCPQDENETGWAWRNHSRAIEKARERWAVDLIHLHGLDFQHYLPAPGIPVLATLHLPPAWYSPAIFGIERPGTYLQCVSASQRQACPESKILVPTIENGVAVSRMPFKALKAGYVLSLGRICPEKGYDIAIRAARQAKRPLIIAGEIYPYEAHSRYFREDLLPHIDGSSCRFIGRVGWSGKCALMANARCVLIPSLVPETSSLVAMESLACGTPVIAFPAGALGDIVDSGKTGFLVESEEEMAAAIEKAGDIDPVLCRTTALERFPAERMIRRYLNLYTELIATWKSRS